MEWDQLLGLLGLLLGLTGGLFGLWWGRKKAAENRGLDERYTSITTKAFANAWKITLVAMYIEFIFVILGLELAAVEVLGTLMIIHLVGWAISMVYYNFKL
ncbi:hypothetical protein Plano_1030 [Planococcus sp. PAMC 21323]|uniref:hypothetical protein n=1 Tax=Planococcus sp. PAMC 21323 TaxID=1526927 RepID=UPI000570DEA0|nr:hypothetical protein [Planococcus sp. PAMC 21323]AIY04995.1 hypothetical protein Plano_1030 [Planococcus sp. PAMC 21323]